MYVRGMNVRDSGIVLSLTERQANRLLEHNEEEDHRILAETVHQITTRRSRLPDANAYIMMACSLTEEETEKLLDGDTNFESHFLTILCEQVENVQRSIKRSEQEFRKSA